jgi:hypothetical protein
MTRDGRTPAFSSQRGRSDRPIGPVSNSVLLWCFAIGRGAGAFPCPSNELMLGLRSAVPRGPFLQAMPSIWRLLLGVAILWQKPVTLKRG